MKDEFANFPLNVPDEIKEVILNEYGCWLNKNGKLHSRTFNLKAPQFLIKWLTDNDLPYGIITYIYKYKPSRIDIPHCQVCGKQLTMRQLLLGKHYCSPKCVANSQSVKDKIRKTNIEKYGCGCVFSSELIKERIKDSLLEKYGVEHPVQNGEIKEKMRLTNIKKYGSGSPFGNKEVQEKIKRTNMERYGDENPFRYGGKLFTELMVEKFGVEHPAQNGEVLQRMKTTNMNRYGVDNASKVQSVKDKISMQRRSPYWVTLVDSLKNKHISVLSSKEEYLVDEILHLKCDRCNHEWFRNGKTEKYGNRPQYIVCPNCASKLYSIKEKELLEFVKSLTKEQIIENDRTVLCGKELDILIPSLNLAIEFNGTYFHSTNNFKEISKTYHAEKTNKCREMGIRLIHVFEYEWDNYKEKIQNLIKTAIGVFDTVLYARLCSVKPISSNEYCEFLKKYHLQSSVNSPIRYGLFYGDELVSVIGFGKSRFETNVTELHRYCVKSGYRIIGGFSKLIAHSNIKNFITYVDMTHFDGRGYKTLGFIEETITPPNYVYVRSREVVSRYRTQKHKLKDFLGEENFDENLTETENMTNNNWFQIYDSGQMKMRYNR